MTPIFFKDPVSHKWKMMAFGYDKRIARDYALMLRQTGYEAFVSNRVMHNHSPEIIKKFKFARF